jgi:hypothetical protein
MASSLPSNGSFPPLARALAWSAPELVNNISQVAIANHLTLMASLASHVSSSQSNGSETLKQLGNLEDTQLKRVLGAPETCHRLYAALQGDHSSWHDFARSVGVEAGTNQLSDNRKGDAWTALGDICYVGGASTKIWRAPRLHDLIVVDFDSPAACRELVESDFRPKFGPFISYKSGERVEILSLISAAVDGLAQEFPIQFAFVVSMIQTVLPRQDTLNPTFKGSSNQTEIGRANLINPQLPGLTSVPIAASLVHEGIHNLLYILEQEAPLIADRNLAFASRVRSPWSHKEVNLRALVHATFVWYAMYFMWNALGTTKAFDPTDTCYLRDFSLRGFTDDRIGIVLRPWAEVIRKDVWAELTSLREVFLD